MIKVAVTPASFSEVPGLRDAYAAETAAVANVASIRQRLATAQSSIYLRRRDRDVLTSRAACDASVTGADVRKAEEAIQEVEALVTLLTAALPKAEGAVQVAGSARAGAVADFERSKSAFLRQELEAATKALQVATAVRDRAQQRVTNWPPELRAELDAIYDAHGRDVAAQQVVAELRRQDGIARSRAMNL